MLLRSERALEAFGARLGRRYRRKVGRGSALVIALEGDLGAGKTTFVRGFGRGLGIRQRMTSPTFVLARRYRIPQRATGDGRVRRRNRRTLPRQAGRFPARWFWHIDAYRLRSPRELTSIDFHEIVADPHNTIAIEWADRMRRAVPADAYWLSFRHHPHGRLVTVRRGVRRCRSARSQDRQRQP